MRDKILIFITLLYISFVFSLPHIYGIWKLKTNYSPFSAAQGLSFIFDETYAYAPETNQILRSGFSGDSYIWENRQKPSLFLGEAASIIPLAALSVITGSTSSAFIISDFIFPPLLFLLLYKGLTSMKLGKLLSASASLGVIIIPFLSLILPKFSSYGTQLTGNINDALFFSRTPHPQISSVFLFAVLFLTANVINKPNKKSVYFWALFIGLSVFASPYVFSTVIGGLVFLTPALYNKLNVKFRIIAVSIIGVFLGLWIINYLFIQGVIGNTDFLLRSTFSKSFLFPNQLRFLALGLVLLIIGRKNILSKVLAFFLLSGSLLVDGHQIIFDRNIEADHWLTRILAPLGTLALFLVVQKLFEKFNFRAKNAVWGFILAALVVTAFFIQKTWITGHPQLINPNQNKEKLLSQINKQTRKDDVIGTLSLNLNDEIAAKTGRLVYVAPGDRTLSNSQEQLQRACDLIALSQRQDDSQLVFAITRYVIGLQKFNKNSLEKSLEDLKSCTKNKYSAAKYKLDYMITGDDLNQQWSLVPVKQMPR